MPFSITTKGIGFQSVCDNPHTVNKLVLLALLDTTLLISPLTAIIMLLFERIALTELHKCVKAKSAQIGVLLKIYFE